MLHGIFCYFGVCRKLEQKQYGAREPQRSRQQLWRLRTEKLLKGGEWEMAWVSDKPNRDPKRGEMLPNKFSYQPFPICTHLPLLAKLRHSPTLPSNFVPTIPSCEELMGPKRWLCIPSTPAVWLTNVRHTKLLNIAPPRVSCIFVQSFFHWDSPLKM